MKYEITGVEFDKDSATEIAELFKKRIQELVDGDTIYLLENGKGYEFEWCTDDHKITIVLSVQFFSIYDDEFNPPDIAPLIERSVTTKLKMYNSEGTELKFTVKPERYYNELFERFQTAAPIDIEELIIKAFEL